MKTSRALFFLAALASIATGCAKNVSVTATDTVTSIQSPSGTLSLNFGMTADGTPTYELLFGDRPAVLPSKLGFEFRGNKIPTSRTLDNTGKKYEAPVDMQSGFKFVGSETCSLDETWNTVWGEESQIRNNYNELAVTLEKKGVQMVVRFRLYDDGLGFRYEFPEQPGLIDFVITKELTEFAMAGDHTAFWIPGDYDTQEYSYNVCKMSEIPSVAAKMTTGNASQQVFSPSGVQTALQLKTGDGLYINIHEAAVVNYPTSNLELDVPSRTFRTHLTPDAEGWGALLQAASHTPWRTVMVVDDARKVLASRLILNLNEPCALEDVSWIHPTKYMGVWWEMIVGGTTWSYTDDHNVIVVGKTDYENSKPHGRHGANNDNVRRYIDFAAANGFDALLIEGWNEGWEDWYGCQKDYVFDFLTPYPDFDLPALNAYAHAKGIRLIMHHETSSSTVNYERHLEAAYDLMNRYGYNAVKSGYVGEIIPYGEHHYSQPLINHYHYCIVEAAKHHIMVNAHEAVRPTGLCRTWPNMIGNESAMGTEFRAMINPGHTCILPFTRQQGGPMDYTPGIFEQDMSITAPGESGKMRHTICNQLGLYVTFYSPLQMAADLLDNYARFPDAFQFIKDVAVDWEKSLYLEAEPGEVIVTARKPRIESLNAAASGLASLPDGKKDCLSSAARFVYGLPESATARDLAKAKAHDVWYVGGVCGEDAREVSVALDFLTPGVRYEAVLYADGPDADYETAPQSYTITRSELTASDTLTVRMARSGGFALSLRSL